MAASKFDLVAIKIGDRRESDLAGARMVRLWDQESGIERVVDLSSRRAQDRYRRLLAERDNERDKLFKRYAVDAINIDTGADFIQPLSVFFRSRAKRK